MKVIGFGTILFIVTLLTVWIIVKVVPFRRIISDLLLKNNVDNVNVIETELVPLNNPTAPLTVAYETIQTATMYPVLGLGHDQYGPGYRAKAPYWSLAGLNALIAPSRSPLRSELLIVFVQFSTNDPRVPNIIITNIFLSICTLVFHIFSANCFHQPINLVTKFLFL